MNAPRSSNPPPDDFERRLMRVPLRSAPPELRARVLGVAAQVLSRAVEPPAPSDAAVHWLTRLWSRFSLGGFGLAATWAVIALLTNADRWMNGAGPTHAPLASPDQVAEARRTRAELLHFAGVEAERGAVRRASEQTPSGKSSPGPRGQLTPPLPQHLGGSTPSDSEAQLALASPSLRSATDGSFTVQLAHTATPS